VGNTLDFRKLIGDIAGFWKYDKALSQLFPSSCEYPDSPFAVRHPRNGFFVRGSVAKADCLTDFCLAKRGTKDAVAMRIEKARGYGAVSKSRGPKRVLDPGISAYEADLPQIPI